MKYTLILYDHRQTVAFFCHSHFYNNYTNNNKCKYQIHFYLRPNGFDDFTIKNDFYNFVLRTSEI